MVRAVVLKEGIRHMLAKLMAGYRLVAPATDGSALLFKEICDPDDIVLDDRVTAVSPKEFLFPQVEEIMSFSESGVSDSGSAPGKTVLLGVKPCDLEAFKIIAAVFTTGRYVDEYFKRRLDGTILVGMGCKTAKPGCFCQERGIDKGFSTACDVFLSDEGAFYAATALSGRGKAVLQEMGVRAEESVIRQNFGQNCDESLKLDVDEGTLFDKINWEKISEKCLGCGACTFICPTCHCFDIKDVPDGPNARRYRCWDSCMYPRFTLHASGHNPRPSKKERYRQRVMHKYHYMKRNFGYTACTGCGRCIRSCPAGMNIKKVVLEIMEELK